MKTQMSLVKVFFALFPNFKVSAKLGPHSGSELSADFTSSTPAAHVDHWVNGDHVWIRIDSLQGPFWKRLLSDHVQWHPPWETALTAAWRLWGLGCGSLWFVLLPARSLLVYPFHAVAGADAGAGCARVLPVSHGGFWKICLFYVACLVALFALGNLDFAFAPFFQSLFWSMGVPHWIFRDACATWFNSGYMFYGRL